MDRLKKFFLKEPRPFTSKREINFTRVKIVCSSVTGLIVLGVLLFPSSKQEQMTFHEKAEKGTIAEYKSPENDPTQETIRQLQESQVNTRSVHSSLDYLYQQDSGSSSGGRSSGEQTRQQNSAMILTRTGTDSKTQLSPGTRIQVKLTEKVTISNQTMPIVGIVSKDVASDSGTAIPSGSKVLGDVSFDESEERASILWRSIILPDGRERPFSAVGMGRDGQVGVDGKVHSDGVKNAVGQTLTRFIGAYASGSMSRGAFGENQGGHGNGLRNAIAETATDRANDMGESMQKERKWIELRAGAETLAVLNQPFSFRDAGAVYGN